MKQIKNISSNTGTFIVGSFTLLLVGFISVMDYFTAPVTAFNKLFPQDRIVLTTVADVGNEINLETEEINLEPTATLTPVLVRQKVVVAAKAVTQAPIQKETKPQESPLPTPAISQEKTPPPSAPLPPTSYDDLFVRHGATYGVDPAVLKKIAKCESGFNPGATNGPYGGMFQFHAGTWQSNRRAMGEDDNPALRFTADEAVKTAAFKISRDGTGAWPVCGR